MTQLVACRLTKAYADTSRSTGKQRDPESTNDYFGARYYASNIAGRFLTPDPSGLSYADPNDPQSLNLYAYVRNNPLRFVDPSGLDCVQVDTGADEVLVAASDCGATGGTFVDGIVDPASFAYDSNGDLTFSFTNSTTGAAGSAVIGLPDGQNLVYNQQVAAAAAVLRPATISSIADTSPVHPRYCASYCWIS